METENRKTTPCVAESSVDSSLSEDAGQAPAARYSDVYKRLFENGYYFGFFQAIRLLEKFFADAHGPGETSDYRKVRIRFHPDTSLVFPATDVKRVDLLEKPLPAAEVSVTFMGLYGIDSPLPVSFYKSLETGAEDTVALRDFLDIFNHRLYAFFYRAWKKYRSSLRFSGTVSNKHANCFKALAGLETPVTTEKPPVPSLKLAESAGRFASRVRNSEGLQQVLSDLIVGINVGIVENVLRWVRIPIRPRLGRKPGLLHMTLCDTATLGEQVADYSGKFQIVLGPLTFAQYKSFLPGGNKARLLDYLVRLYVPDYLDYDVKLRIKMTEIPTTRLGGRMAKLGRDMWLGRPTHEWTEYVVAYT